MDLNKTIRDLYADKERLDRLIQLLEELVANRRGTQGLKLPRSGRGRKFMGAKERKEVSRRMKKYWEKRRAQQTNGA
jgi:hypothetical protein